MFFILEDSNKSESRIVIPTKMFFRSMYLHRRENKYDIIGFLLLFFFLKISLFIYLFWLCWVFVAARGLSLVAASGGYSSLLCAGFSC